MIQLTADECRVLGVLVEKAFTVPSQYPMSLNGVTVGCNQKSNRDPVVEMDDSRVDHALNTLRNKGLVILVDMMNSRVLKYKHEARATLSVNTAELVILTELLLRGPQTLGELRTRASRMHALDSLETVKSQLDSLMGRESPLVRRLAPAPGSRAERYAQLLCPTLHKEHESPAPTPQSAPLQTPSTPDLQLAHRVEILETEVAQLRAAVTALRDALGG